MLRQSYKWKYTERETLQIKWTMKQQIQLDRAYKLSA